MHEPGTGHYALLRAFQEDDVLDTMVAEAEKHDYLAHEFGDAVLLERSEMIPNDGAAVMPRRRTRMNTLVTSTSRKVVSPSRRLAGPPGFAQPARLRPRWLSASYTEYPAAFGERRRVLDVDLSIAQRAPSWPRQAGAREVLPCRPGSC